MDPFVTAVVSAMGTVTSGALSGAGGEMGRRSSEALFGLLRRAQRDGGGSGEDRSPGDPGDRGDSGDPGDSGDQGGSPSLPVTEEERRVLADRLADCARRSPEFARDVMRWARESEWLAPRVVPAVAQGASRPRMLPPVTAAFTDRDAVLEEIQQMLDEEERPAGSPAVVVLVGPGGIGKSATAVHCAHALEERFPDGQLHVNLAGAAVSTALAPSEVLARFLDRLGVAPRRMPADERLREELYRDCTADRRMVVVLDDAASASQVRPLLPAAAGALVIVTSRRRLDGLVAGTGARHIVLPPLSLADSVRLLGRIVGRGRMAGREAGARAVAARCGGIPLALCAAGASVAVREHLTFDAVDRRLSAAEDGPDEEAPAVNGGDPADPVRRVNDVTYAELSPRSALLYRMAGAWAWPSVTVAVAAKAAGIGEDEARASLEELAEVHLIEEVGEERYRFHDLVRLHARERAEAEDGHTAVAASVRRVAGWYLGFAAAADLRVVPARWHLGPAYLRLAPPAERGPEDGRAALAALRHERENLAAAVRAAAHHGFDELVWQLCEAMWGLHLRLGFHEQWVESHLLGADAARRCAEQFGDPRAEGRMLVQLAFAHMGLGRLDEAEEALAAAAVTDERAGHHRGRATAVEVLGLLRLRQWRYAEAEERFTEAQRILARVRPGEDGWEDVPRALAILEHHIGRALRGQGLLADATRRLLDALARFRALDVPDLYNEGRVYMSLGETHLDAGEPRLARVCLDRAVSTMGDEGAALQLADAAELRARCARDLAEPAEEAAALRTAEGLYDTAGDHESLARVRARLTELGEGGDR